MRKQWASARLKATLWATWAAIALGGLLVTADQLTAGPPRCIDYVCAGDVDCLQVDCLVCQHTSTGTKRCGM